MMNYKIKMSKNDFFKINNKLLASNLEIEDDDVIFEVEAGSFNILKKTNYEFKVLESIGQLSPRPTCILITHRRSVLKICDREIKINNGKIESLIV